MIAIKLNEATTSGSIGGFAMPLGPMLHSSIFGPQKKKKKKKT